MHFPGLQAPMNVVVPCYVLTSGLSKGLGPMAQRITRLTTDQKIAGSNPAGIEKFFLHW